jgi:hypothetical protein
MIIKYLDSFNIYCILILIGNVDTIKTLLPAWNLAITSLRSTYLNQLNNLTDTADFDTNSKTLLDLLLTCKMDRTSLRSTYHKTKESTLLSWLNPVSALGRAK